jgi:hypothetical protein
MNKNAVDFAVACVETNSLNDLKTITEGSWMTSNPWNDDCKTWDITEWEWVWAINTAIEALETGKSILSNGELY